MSNVFANYVHSPVCHFVGQSWQFSRVFAQNYFFPRALHYLMYSDSARARVIQCFLVKHCRALQRMFAWVIYAVQQAPARVQNVSH